MRRRALLAAGLGLFVACSNHHNGPAAPGVRQEGPTTIVAGNASTCLLAQSGTAYCWGLDSAGTLGIGVSPASVLTPDQVAGTHVFSALSGAEVFRCGLAGQTPLCWGQTLIGSHGHLYTDSVPTVVASNVPPLATISAGPSHACGLTKSGVAYCWGENFFGQLGTGDTLRHTTAVPVAGGIRWSAISVGFWHTCALAADSTAYCWGENLAGELAASPDTLPLSTTPVAIIGYKFASLTTGSLYTCGVDAEGFVFCWGWNYAGNLGDSTTTNRARPTLIHQSGLVFRSVVASSANSLVLTTCGITISAAAYCWGWNGYEQLGNPNAPFANCDSVATSAASCSSLVPFPVAGEFQFASVSVGTTHACGVTLGHAAYCWGLNDHGQLGTGSFMASPFPIPVSGHVAAAQRVIPYASQ